MSLGTGLTGVPGAAFLAAQRGTRLNAGTLLLLAAAAAVVVLLAGAGLFVLRKMTLGKGPRSDDAALLEKMEKLHRRGLISVEEHNRVRRSALGLTAEAPPAGEQPQTRPETANTEQEDRRQGGPDEA